jgi:hypothetical protein
MKNPNYCLIALLGCVVRAVGFGCGIGDALAIAALCGLYGFTLYIKSKESKPLEEKVWQEISDLKSSVSALKLGRSFGKN